MCAHWMSLNTASNPEQNCPSQVLLLVSRRIAVYVDLVITNLKAKNLQKSASIPCPRHLSQLLKCIVGHTDQSLPKLSPDLMVKLRYRLLGRRKKKRRRVMLAVLTCVTKESVGVVHIVSHYTINGSRRQFAF